eukprot:CAMPEP_0172856318 /NCGR_PEP_ID=MMETSP1075-20121228/63975_1 /TAXON_ID=2916 /ORGANISM="Ceratium fusus, Strain PA161109" /LENGTH=78 /DNA_ID=CAMNT_0013703493 /DNA_START=27 /DNA_END=261 /DNA_ORIENTATION=-
MDIDLLNPDPQEEKTKHKLKRMIQGPNSFFMDVKCPGCLQSRQSIAMRKQWFFVGAATRCSANPPAALLGLRRVARSA